VISLAFGEWLRGNKNYDEKIVTAKKGADPICRRSKVVKVYTLTLHVTILLGKLTVCQLVTKFPVFYETRKFITLFTEARHWPVIWMANNLGLISAFRKKVPFNLKVTRQLRITKSSEKFTSMEPAQSLT
jgi:hypothetical protein